jgi:ribosomal protein S12 methylthiotransferase accessory factor
MTDGGHRSLVPEETVQALAPLVSPLVGIVRAVESGGAGDPERTPLYLAAPTLAGLPGQEGAPHLFLRGYGKGRTRWQAKASAIGEAVERYSAVYSGDVEWQVVSRMASLDHPPVAPGRILGFSDVQYLARDEWNVAHPEATEWVPERFDEQQPIAWTRAWSLTHACWSYVPSALCYFNQPRDPGPVFAVTDSNGNAAGNNMEEAILQGLMELVERDAAGIWWFNRLRRPGVHLPALEEPYLDDLVAFYRERGRTFWMLDLTTDLAIPAFAAVSAHADDERGIAMGFGAHLDPRVAALRAATECNQVSWWQAERAVVGRSGPTRDAGGWQAEALANHCYLVPSTDRWQPTTHGTGSGERTDLREEIEAVVRQLRDHGLDVLVVDQTRPDLVLKAVKVFVPGLAHFRRRLGHTRLYDVPVRLGWSAERSQEQALNPLPLPV